MFAMGHKQTCAAHKAMSALAPKADMCSAQVDVRYVPIADMDGVILQIVGTVRKTTASHPCRHQHH